MENPRFYRCINTQRGTGFTFDKIYKIRFPNNLNNYGNFIDDNKDYNGFHPDNHKWFTPVTELEWNLQEGIITPITKQDYSYLINILEKHNIK